jgi:hypothetical protein
MEWIGCARCENSNATSFSELMHLWRQFGQFCLVFRAVMIRSDMRPNMSFGSNGVDQVCSLRKDPTQLHEVTKQSETPQNMSFGSNGVVQVCSLRKILKQLRLANVCVNSTYSASFASNFVH